MARPSKITPPIRAQVVQALVGGSTLRDAAHFAGIAESTLMNALRLGRAHEDEQVESEQAALVADVERALATARIAAAASLRSRFAEDWRSAEAFLRRRDPANWSDRVVVEGNPAKPLATTVVAKLTPDETRELIAKLLAD